MRHLVATVASEVFNLSNRRHKTGLPMRLTQPLYDVAIALALLTRLPLPRLPDRAFDRQAQAVWAYPVVGLVVGSVATLVGHATVGLSAPVAAGLVIAIQVLMTGAMHEDGLADSADGLWGGLTRDRRLEIMRDSRIGTYGVMALILSIGLRWSALTALLPNAPWAVCIAAIGSRAAMPALMATLPHARQDGLAKGVGRPVMTTAAVAIGVAIILIWALAGSVPFAPLGLAVITTVGLGALAKSKLGGTTGDILGASQQLADIAILIGFLML